MGAGTARANLPLDAPPENDARRPRRVLLAAAILLGFTLAVFGEALFAGGDTVASGPRSDIPLQYAAWRQFGFSQLRQGNFALWNPHVYSGAPFFGGLQSGLLYPLNSQYLFLPLARAINVGMALHVFLGGLFMYLWASRRGLRFLACLFCGVLWMFCGQHYYHVEAGHLTGLISTAWIPLLFLAMDGLFEDGPDSTPHSALRTPHSKWWSWVLLGSLTIAMMTLGGDAQYLFHTGVAAALYSVLRLVRAEKRLRIFLGLAAMCAGGFAIAAVQLLAGFETTAESLRGGHGVSYAYASIFSFPPENLVTFVVPGFFGPDPGTELFHYWGRCFLWEMCLFIGVTGLFLAVYGAIAGDRAKRRFSIVMVLALLVLALGCRTPLFHLLYNWAPGFNRFRGMSKFAVQATAFLVLLSGVGLDKLLRAEKFNPRLAAGPLLLAALLVGIGAGLVDFGGKFVPNRWWFRSMEALRDSRESYMLGPAKCDDAAFMRQAQDCAGRSLLWAAVPCAAAGACLLFFKSSRRLALCLAILGMGEMLVFAWSATATFDLSNSLFSSLKPFFKEHPGDFRVLQPAEGNLVMAAGGYDVWGYGPLPPKRYGQFIAFTQGQDPETAEPAQVLRWYFPIHRMLRCRYSFLPWGGAQSHEIMPHVALVPEYLLLKDRNQEIFPTLMNPFFDPNRQVILESKPDPEPAPAGKPAPAAKPGTAEVVESESGTDRLVITADTPSPAVLLVTDGWSAGWRARGLPGSAQSQYQVMPANYCLRAVPLKAGHHEIVMEFLPPGYRIGRWISIVAACGWLVALGWVFAKKRRTAAVSMQ